MVRQSGVALLVFGLGYRPGQLIRDGQPWCVLAVAAVAEAAVATDRAPAAAMTMALDRLSRIFRCRDKGTFR